MNSLKTRIITSLEEFSDCQVEWNALVSKNVFQSWEWQFSWWNAFQDLGDLAIVVVLDDDENWLGFAPWFKTSSVSRGKKVRMLGSGQACSDYSSFAVVPGSERVVVDEILRVSLGPDCDPVFSNVNLFEFEGHTEDDLVMQAIAARLSPQWGDCDVTEIGGAWKTSLPGTWEEFEKSLRKSFQRKTRKASKRLESPEFQALVCGTNQQIKDRWGDFVSLHQKRRESLGEPGCFADEKFESFLRNATFLLAEAGKAQINMILFEGQPMTANLEFTSGDSTFMYQTGMDPQHLKLEPGHVTFTWAIQDSINREMQTFDFLRGDEPYKRFWNSNRVSLFRTRIVPNRFSANLRQSLFVAGKQVVSWAQNVKSSFGSPAH